MCAEEVSTAMEKPDCLYVREVESLIRELRYIRKKNYDRQNGKCDGETAFQRIRNKTTELIEDLIFVLRKRRD